MTGHVVFVGLALVLCTAVPSANTTANADSNPEIIVGTEDVIIVRNIASTQPSSETPKKSSPYFTVTTTELPVPTTTSTTEDSASTMQTIYELQAPAAASVTEVVTRSPSAETTTPVSTLAAEAAEVPTTTRSSLSHASTTTTLASRTETASESWSTISSVQVKSETGPTTVSWILSSTSTTPAVSSTTSSASTTSTDSSSTVGTTFAAETFTTLSTTTAVPTSVPSTSTVAPSTVPSTTTTTTTTSPSTQSPSTTRSLSATSTISTTDNGAGATTITSSSTTTSSSKGESTPLPSTTPMPSSVVTGFRRTVNRLGPSTALPSTVAQLLQLHKTQELLRQAAVVARIRQRYTAAMRVFYQNGNSEADLPECSAMQVCNKVDVYSTPWVERQCRCPARTTCSKSVDAADGHTVADKSRLYKTCEPVKELPECRFFRDATWTIEQTASNHTRQTLHCTCPRNAVAYLAKYELVPNVSGVNFKYSFACSPQVRQKCQPAEPCRLFTVKKRRVVDEVNSDTLCDCPAKQWCPSHHTDSSISPGSFFKEDHLKIFTGFCQPVA